MRGSGRTLAWLTLAGLGLLVPAALLAGMMMSPDRLLGVGDLPEPLVVPVEEVLYDEQIGVSVTLQWTEGPSLFAPPWAGTVGQVSVMAGDVLRSGDTVATIDGVDRMAVATPQPFHRSLGLRQSGEDVAWLQDVLIQLGYLQELPADRDTVSSGVLQAIRDLAVDLGVDGRVDAFEPAWFVWMPDDSFLVERVALQSGGQGPPAGAPVLTGPPALVDVIMQPLEGGVLRLTPDTRYQLAIEDDLYPMDPTTSSLNAESRAELAMSIPPLLDSVSGTIRRVEAVRVWAIPSAAVQTAEDGRLCIFKESGTGFESIPVEVVAGRAGITFVEPADSSAISLLVNPADVLEDPACPSA